MKTSLLNGYKPRLSLMKHQLSCLEAIDKRPSTPASSDAFAILAEMGTGKSAMLLADWGRGLMNGGPRDLLIVAPAGSYRNWFADKGDDPEFWCEIRKHVDPAVMERTVVHGWRGGKTKTERDTLTKFLALQDPRMPRVLVMNVEALSVVERAQELCEEFLGQRESYMGIDEATIIKSHRSSRTKTCWELGQLAQTRRIMSGLWTPKGPMDLFAQCYFLDPKILGFTNYFAFQRRYAQMVRREAGGRKFWQIVGFQNIEDLQKRVAPYSYRILKSACLDLEPKSYTSRDVELTREQARMIKEIKLFGNASIGDTGRFVTTDMIIKQIARITQIACGYVMDDEERVLHEVPENRTDALVAVLQEHVGKAIVWCPWRPPLQKIVERLKKEFGPRSVAQWHGGNKKERGEEERRFLNDPECLFMCATQGAGMRGNTWTVADLTVYYANNYDLEQRDQSEDRNHRKGQTKKVTVCDLIAQGTNDVKVVRNLRQKIDLATMINQEGYREWLI